MSSRDNRALRIIARLAERGMQSLDGGDPARAMASFARLELIRPYLSDEQSEQAAPLLVKCADQIDDFCTASVLDEDMRERLLLLSVGFREKLGSL